jgi:hypothetical protein
MNRHFPYPFETGADLSTLSESEALRLGTESKDVNSSGGSADINRRLHAVPIV